MTSTPATPRSPRASSLLRRFVGMALAAGWLGGSLACSDDEALGESRGPERDASRPPSEPRDDSTSDTDPDADVPEPDEDAVPGDDAGDGAPSCTEDGPFCAGRDVMRCVAGVAVRDRTCTGACADGACVVNDCADEKGYFGCSFLAVDLDNASIGIGGSTPAADEVWGVVVSNPNDYPVVTTLTDARARIVGGPDVVAPGAVHIFEPPQANADGSILAPLAFRVEADGPVTVHQFNPLNREETYSNDASLLYPVSSLGTEYRVLAWPTEVPPVLFPGSENVLNTFVTLAAPGPGPTRVEIDLPPGVAIAAGDGVDAIPAGGSAAFVLQPLDVLSLTTPQVDGMDPSGARIRADRPIAVFAGAECAYVPRGSSFCDHLEQQLLPVDRWGTRTTVAKTRPRGAEPDIFRVVAAYDGTELTTAPPQPGATGVVLDAGEVLQFASTESFVLSSSQPALVGQLLVGADHPSGSAPCNRDDGGAGCAIRSDPRCPQSSGDSGSVGGGYGDPSFTILVPDARRLDTYVVLTPRDYLEDWLTLVAPEGTELWIDDAPLTEPGLPIAGSDQRVHHVPTTPGAHRVRGSAPFALYAYGHGCAVSYGYAGGMELGPLP